MANLYRCGGLTPVTNTVSISKNVNTKITLGFKPSILLCYFYIDSNSTLVSFYINETKYGGGINNYTSDITSIDIDGFHYKYVNAGGSLTYYVFS